MNRFQFFSIFSKSFPPYRNSTVIPCKGSAQFSSIPASTSQYHPSVFSSSCLIFSVNVFIILPPHRLIAVPSAGFDWWMVSLLWTCPNHLSRFDFRNSSIKSVFVILLISSFLILSSLVVPHIHLSIFIPVSASLLTSASSLHCPCFPCVSSC